MKHTEKSPLAGKIYYLKEHLNNEDGSRVKYLVEDWWDHLTGESWMNANGNPAALKYAMRTGLSKIEVPTDDEVLYGKIGIFGHLIHISEIDVEAGEVEV